MENIFKIILISCSILFFNWDLDGHICKAYIKKANLTETDNVIYVEPIRDAIRWGEFNEDAGAPPKDIAIDDDGNIYITGYFFGDIDFNPSEGQEIRTSMGIKSAYLMMLNQESELEWIRTWGNDRRAKSNGISLDDSNNCYIIGSIIGEVDLNPGDGVSMHGYKDKVTVFFSKFDANGVFQWTKTWGEGVGLGICTSGPNNVFVTGYYWGEVDFDPGSDSISAYTASERNAFISKFDSNGDFYWVKTWGGDGKDYANQILSDHLDDLFVVSHIHDICDLDPGIRNHSSGLASGEPGSTIISFNDEGEFQWANVWSGISNREIALGNDENIYIAGSNPPLIQNYTLDGVLIWERSWGVQNDRIEGITSSYAGGVYAIGSFNETIDFDPGTESEIRSIDDNGLFFLTYYNSFGEFQWVVQWDWDDLGTPLGCNTDEYGNLYIYGWDVKTQNFANTQFINNGSFIWRFSP